MPFALSYWFSGPYWVVPAIGLASTGLALMVGRLLVARRRQAAPPPPPREDAAPATSNDPFVHGSATERRVAMRRRGNPVEVNLSDPEAKSDLGRGWVIDRSVGGLAILVERAVTAGTILSVRPVNAPLGMTWVQIEVRSCRQEGKEWELGCRFLRTPPWAAMLTFG